VPTHAFKPRLWPEKEFIESYTFWIQLDGGDTILVSLLISNLGHPQQPGVAVALYPASGPSFRSAVDYPSDRLKIQGDKIAFADSTYEKVGDKYRLRLNMPVKTGGRFVSDFTFTPTLPSFFRGNGQIEYAEGRRFELLVLYPRSRVEGSYTYQGKTVAVSGVAYGDHAAQNLWPHHIADRWVNYRFFSPELNVAVTSCTASSRFDHARVTHALVADGEKLRFSTDTQQLELRGGSVDSTSGYRVPQALATTLTGPDLKLKLDVPLGRPLDRIYLFADLNPFLRTFLRTFIANPYAYRFRQSTQAILYEGKNEPRRIKGTFLAEIIFVNE
jgi:hypothetical protein